jgi:hypothetical protein
MDEGNVGGLNSSEMDGDDGRDDKRMMVAVMDYHTVARMKKCI